MTGVVTGADAALALGVTAAVGLLAALITVAAAVIGAAVLGAVGARLLLAVLDPTYPRRRPDGGSDLDPDHTEEIARVR